MIIASPRPIWAHISRARSILYIKGFPTHYWTRLLGAIFTILSQSYDVCLGPLTAGLAIDCPCACVYARPTAPDPESTARVVPVRSRGTFPYRETRLNTAAITKFAKKL